MDKIIEKLKAIVSEFEASKTDGNELISAEEARKLGAGKAEWYAPMDKTWNVCDSHFTYTEKFEWRKDPYFGVRIKYRAIKQPEPADPHAELKAMYEQQVKNTAEGKAGGLEDFVWEFYSQEYPRWDGAGIPFFASTYQYRCTPKPICQVKNLDTGKTETMTREAAKLLQAETKSVCDWFTPLGSQLESDDDSFGFVSTGIYTYKLKAKPLKQVSWKDVPVWVMTNKGEYRAYARDLVWCETKKHGCPSLAGYTPCQLELAPASEQPWLVYIQGETDLSSLKGMEIEVKRWSASRGNFVVNSYKDLGLLLNNFIVAYRITGLAEGYEFK